MNYLDRPVFLFDFDWSRQPVRTFDYDLRELSIGFGWPRFAPTQAHVVNGFEITLWLVSEAEIVAVDEFFDALRGPLRGFWFAEPQVFAQIASGVGASTFDIFDQNERDSWADNPCKHLLFTKAGQDPQAAEISSITLSGNLERVTLTAPLALPADETWSVRRLRYVRLAGEEESGEYDCEGRMTRTLRVVELPLEYAAIEIGVQPVYLYHFWAVMGATQIDWRFTSYWDAVESDGQIFTPKAITHGSLSRTAKGDKESATIEAFYETGHPLALFVPFTLPVTLYVEIIETTLPEPDDVAVVFTGQVQGVEVKGKRMTARCSSLLDALSRKLPRFVIGPRCNYQTYEPGTCKLNRADWEEAGTFHTITGTTVRVTGLPADFADDYFADGWLETGTGPTFEVRTIVSDTRVNANTHDLVLNQPLNHAALLQAVTLLPGDDHRAATCQEKFNNFVNFGGHPFVPNSNLTLQAIRASPSSGGKK